MQILVDLLFIHVISSDALKEFIESLQLLGTIHKLGGEFTWIFHPLQTQRQLPSNSRLSQGFRCCILRLPGLLSREPKRGLEVQSSSTNWIPNLYVEDCKYWSWIPSCIDNIYIINLSIYQHNIYVTICIDNIYIIFTYLSICLSIHPSIWHPFWECFVGSIYPPIHPSIWHPFWECFVGSIYLSIHRSGIHFGSVSLDPKTIVCLHSTFTVFFWGVHARKFKTSRWHSLSFHNYNVISLFEWTRSLSLSLSLSFSLSLSLSPSLSLSLSLALSPPLFLQNSPYLKKEMIVKQGMSVGVTPCFKMFKQTRMQLSDERLLGFPV